MEPSPYRHTVTALVFAALLGAVAVLGGQQATSAGASTMQRDFAGLVDIGGGRRMYLECRGQGSPTVVLVSGFGDHAGIWSLDAPEVPQPPVLPAVAGFTRVCIYDRPGTIVVGEDDTPLPSRSDPVPQPRAADDTVADLHALLRAAPVPGPYVLAAHSLGGLYARLYAATYPDEVVGLVLVDATNEYARTALTPEAWAFAAANAGVPSPALVSSYPEAERADFNAALDAMERAAAAQPLRQLPLVVLSRGREEELPPEALEGVPPGFPDAYAGAWRAGQARLAALLPDTRQVIASESGHYIHVEQPELVIEAIRQVVAGVRHPDTWYDLTSCCAATTSTSTPGRMAGSPALKPIDRAALQATVDAAIREMLVPGAIVLVRTPQGEVTISAGTTELGATIAPRADTYFRIASITKTMTAAVIMQLAHENRLSLSDPISKYVPGVPNGDIITIAELLAMRSGLYNYTNAPELAASLDRDPTRVWTPQEVLAVAFARPPNVAPGTEYEYNNTNYALLGLIAEAVDGRPLAQAMQERLFGPLGLERTLLPAPTVNTLPVPYTHGYLYGSSSVALYGEPPYSPEVQAAARAGTLLPTDYTDLNQSWAEAAGGVISTAGDLATWIEALVGGRVLDAATQRRWLDSLQPKDPSRPDGQQYGYGIDQMRLAAIRIYFHGGETPGYNSFMGHDPTNQVTLVVWANQPVSLDMKLTAFALTEKVLDQLYVDLP
jgi:D-alanyl-D-alanine carboxypeptidase